MNETHTTGFRAARTVVTAVLLCACAALPAHAQEQIWLKQFGTGSNDYAKAVTPDGEGGTFVGGGTEGSLGGASAGLEDVFVARYSSDGDQLWLKQFGSSNLDHVIAIVSVDAAGGGGGGGARDFVIAGYTLGNLAGANVGQEDAFIARYNAAGSQLWIHQLGTDRHDEIRALAPDGNGGVFVAGFTFGALGGAHMGGRDSFFARYDAGGNQLWIRHYGTTDSDSANALASDGAGGFFVAGAIDRDAFLFRYDGSGNQLWNKLFGSSGHNSANALARGIGGGVMMAGSTTGGFGSPVLGFADCFVASYDDLGNQIWLRQFGAAGFEEDALAVVIDDEGGPLVGGFTTGDLGGPISGWWNPFVASYDIAGNQNWVTQFSLLGYDLFFDMASDSLGGVVVAGAATGTGAPFEAFLARFNLPDTDGDGLFDDWEINGVPYTSGAGLPARYLLPGADPMHKDMFLEVDEMAGMTLSAFAMTAVEASFANAPLTNPDGVDGITLHIVRDESVLPLVSPWATDGCWPLDFDAVRSAWYGTAAERAVSDPAALLGAKAKAFRYCIVAEKSGPRSIGGCGQRPGDNIVMYAGKKNDFTQASVMMHELGHNLNLRHGGGDDVNGKPNYPSVMNYVLAYQMNWNQSFWRLDYSRAPAGAFGSLDESSLVERAGVGNWPTRNGLYKDFFMPFGVNKKDTGGNTVRLIAYAKLDNSLTDFGDVAGTMFQDGNKRSVDILQDLNYAASGPGVPFGIPSSPTPGQTLEPYDDWANVKLPLAASLGAGAPISSFPQDELTDEAQAWIEANFPVPPTPCYADCDLSTGVGVLDVFDFLCFQNDFVNGESYACDCDTSTGVGVCDVFDFLCFQNAFVAGCP